MFTAALPIAALNASSPDPTPYGLILPPTAPYAPSFIAWLVVLIGIVIAPLLLYFVTKGIKAFTSSPLKLYNELRSAIEAILPPLAQSANNTKLSLSTADAARVTPLLKRFSDTVLSTKLEATTPGELERAAQNFPAQSAEQHLTRLLHRLSLIEYGDPEPLSITDFSQQLNQLQSALATKLPTQKGGSR